VTGAEQIEAVLAGHKAAGRSSPAGMAWHEFCAGLSAMKPAEAPNPPVALILAASGESDASKHSRLRQQLDWADQHSLLDVALSRLGEIPPEQWNTGRRDNWHVDNYGVE
jgi:hypothetical protein